MAFLRISNLVPKSLNEYDSTRDIRRGDITINKGGINVFIRWAKSLQKYNQVATIPLFKLSNSPLCPLVNLQYLNTQYPVRPSDPLLSYYSGKVLNVITQAQLRAAFARIVSSANLDHNLTFHALWRSGASLAFASGSAIREHSGPWHMDIRCPMGIHTSFGQDFFIRLKPYSVFFYTTPRFCRRFLKEMLFCHILARCVHLMQLLCTKFVGINPSYMCAKKFVGVVVFEKMGFKE
jgi:hypothetical protein